MSRSEWSSEREPVEATEMSEELDMVLPGMAGLLVREKYAGGLKERLKLAIFGSSVPVAAFLVPFKIGLYATRCLRRNTVAV